MKVRCLKLGRARLLRTLGLALLAGLGLVVSAASAESLRSQLDKIPPPLLDSFELGVAEQLTEARDRASALAAAADSKDEGAEKAVGLAFGQLGVLYFLYDFPESAQLAFLVAVDQLPQDHRWPYYLALLSELDGDYEAALSWAEKASLLDSALFLQLRRARFFLEVGNCAEAAPLFEEVLSREPEISAALFGKARCLEESDSSEEVVDLYRRALKAQPEGSVVHHHLGMALRRGGDREGALEQLKLNQGARVVQRDPLLEHLKSLNVSREAFFKQGTAAMRRGDFDLAVNSFERILAAQPEDPESHFNTAMAMIEMGQLERAEFHLRKALEVREDYRDPHFNLGLMLARSDRLGEAEKHLRRAVALDEEDLGARVRLADVLVNLDRPSEALGEVDRVLERDAGVAAAHLVRGAALVALGRTTEGREALQRVLEFAPGAVASRSEALFRLSALAQQEGDMQAAFSLAKQAVEVEPQFAPGWVRVGRLEAQSGQFEEAAASLGRAVLLVPDSERWRFDRAMAYLLGGMDRQAKEWLQESVEVIATSLPLKHLLARILATSRDTSVRDGLLAVELANEVFSQQQGFDHAETLAMALAESGQFDRAIELQEEVISREQSGGSGARQDRLDRLESYRNGQPVREPWRNE